MESSAHDFGFQAPGIEELQPLFPAFEIQGFIAQGGMGAVYYAVQRSLDRRVAIKILPRQFGEDPQFRASFEAEAKAMARLNHPNLIGVYDFGEVDGFLFIIMEMVEGKSLHHSANGRMIEQKEAARIVAGICHGLANAHSQGILHRDIKPANILLGPGAVPKIGDFGLARPVGEEHNPDEIVFGTPGYSAPEVVNHPEAVDQRADFYSVGVMLYELLTGQFPDEPYQPPSRLAKCDPGFDPIIRRATHPSPKMRYGDAEEIAKDLEKILKRLKGGPRLQTASAATAVAGSPMATKPIRPVSGTRKSSAGPFAIAAVLVAVLVVGILVAINSGNNDPPVVQPDEKPSTPDLEPVVERIPEPARPPTIANRNPEPEPEPAPEDPEPIEPEPEPQETTAEALVRLRPNLRKGDFSEMPPGTVEYGDAHLLLVNQPLSWLEAMQFAEDHGAQLAVLDSPDDLAWANSQFKSSALVWLGLSDSGTEGNWHWVNGAATETSLWAPGQPDNTSSPDDGEDFAVLLPGVNQLDDLPASRELPFLLQWSSQGPNEGSLEQQLARTGEALRSRQAPVFPAGTRNVNGSRFLWVPHTGSWDEASAIATGAGGHLAVPSSGSEAAFIMETARARLGQGKSCWVGGRQVGSDRVKWSFVTGERFEFITWGPGQPDDLERSQPCLQILRFTEDGDALGYDNSTAVEETTAAFLLEWSAPSRRNMPSEEELNAPDTPEEWLTAHREAIAAAERLPFGSYRRRWERNVEDFAGDIRATVQFFLDQRGEPRERKNAAEKLAEDFAKSIEKEGRIPDELPGAARRLVGKLHGEALEKQQKIWESYKPDFESALERYLAGVSNQAQQFTRIGDRGGADYLEREHRATAGDHDRFHAILSGEMPPVPDAGVGE